MEEDGNFEEFYKRAKANAPKMLALVGTGLQVSLDNQMEIQDALKKHCDTPIDTAHPPAYNDGNCGEDDVSKEAPKEGTIFFKGKLSGRWLERIIVFIAALIAGVGVVKLFGG